MPRKPIRTVPRPVEFTAGPFRGMRDAPAPTTHSPEFALLALNCYRKPGPAGGEYLGRPGWERLGETAVGAAVQAVASWTNAAGVIIRCAVVDGEIQTWNGSAWSIAVTAANLTTASVTLATTGRVSLTPFAGKLMISDGTNALITWDGTAGAGGIAQVSGVGPFFGPLTVYYAKLFGILNRDAGAGVRKTLVWSEENDPTLGYDVAPYNNAWDNPGGYTDPLTAIEADNDALYVFRERVSITITGAVNSDFQTAGTRANLSDVIGTTSPWAVLLVPQGVVIVDADAEPWLVRHGMDPVSLAGDCQEQFMLIPRASLVNCLAQWDHGTQTIVVGYPDVGQTLPTRWLAFSLEDVQFMGVWTWNNPAVCAGPWVTGDGIRRWAHAGTDDGVYQIGSPDVGPWDDALLAADAPIAHEVTTGSLGYDMESEWTVRSVEVALGPQDVTDVTVTYETPRGLGTSQTVNATAVGGGGIWGQFLWGTGLWGGTSRDKRVRVGTFGRGRWVRATVRHEQAGEPFGVIGFRVRGTAVDGNIRTP